MLMEKGKHVITVYMKKGNANLKSLNIVQVAEKSNITLDFSKNETDKMTHTDGINWSVINGQLRGEGIGKRTYGDVSLGDYIYEGDITFDSRNISGGLLVRTSNASDSHRRAFDNFADVPNESAAKIGENWMQGYYIQFTAREIVLKKCNYNIKEVKVADYRMNTDTTYNFKVVCEGANIKLYLNNELVLDYTDKDPYLSGSFGMRITNGSAVYGNIKVSEIK